MPNIAPSDLKHGDVLLYYGTSLVSELIRQFDGSPYSHASIYDGTQIFEAIAEGCVKRPAATSVIDGSPKYVDVYRFVSGDGHQIDDPGYGFDPIEGVIDGYAAAHERYAYEELILLAVLTSTRRIQIPVIGWMLRWILDHAMDVLAQIMAAGKQPMICSELVYRCYAEAGTQYELEISGADPAMLAATQGLELPMRPTHDAESADIDRRINAFLTNYAAAKHKGKVALTPKGVAPSLSATNLAIADFVSPRDLKDSPDLQLVGRLTGV